VVIVSVVGVPAQVTAPSGLHGFPAELTSFIGREEPVRVLVELLGEHRLVTVTGPGGSGKTRLAGQVARRVAVRFMDGSWLAELAPVTDPAQVSVAVADALGIPEQPGVPMAEVLGGALSRQQMLLVLDNCEQVIDAVAELCARLLATCDELRILATSREPLRVVGEARYRLGPLALPSSADSPDTAQSEAVKLFTERARRADPHFCLDREQGPLVARLVTRLDGMPLAIELAAARVEALGLAQLLERLDDRFAWLSAGDRLAVCRHRSLAAAVDWSYQLLAAREQQVFRALSAFPGPFTMAAAEAVAGNQAGPAVLRLVDCSMLAPPRTGMDGRARYLMLETLRAYGAALLAEADEADLIATAQAGYALEVAERAAAGLQTADGEAAAARWLDAEDALMRQALAWTTGHDPSGALRLAAALGWWWLLRGHLASQYTLLCEITSQGMTGSDPWCTAHLWLGLAALFSTTPAQTLKHFTDLRDAVEGRGPSRALADGLMGRATALTNLGRAAEAAADARRSLAVAREVDYRTGELLALGNLSFAAVVADDPDGAVQAARQATQITTGVPGVFARWSHYVLTGALIAAGDFATADEVCTEALAQARAAGSVDVEEILLAEHVVILDLWAGRIEDAAAHLHDALQLALRNGQRGSLMNSLDCCGYLCAATGRPADAVTAWAALAAVERKDGSAAPPYDERRREQLLDQARQKLGVTRARAAEARGSAMSLATAAEYALMLTHLSGPAQPASSSPQLSPRECELITLVARGHTDAQIAAELYISIRTVRSHLDRIRDKTGCRRRADLTRLALNAGLV
jgi:predicted ATPase/DNA-binding CsgD family transcriptional regulator